MGSQSCYILLICALFLSGLPAVQVPTRLGPYGIAAPATSLPSHRSAAPASPAVLASVAIGAPAPQATLSVQPPVLNFTLPQGGGSASQPLTLTASGGALNFMATAATDDGGNWLSVSPSSGTINPTSAQIFSIQRITYGSPLIDSLPVNQFPRGNLSGDYYTAVIQGTGLSEVTGFSASNPNVSGTVTSATDSTVTVQISSTSVPLNYTQNAPISSVSFVLQAPRGSVDSGSVTFDIVIGPPPQLTSFAVTNGVTSIPIGVLTTISLSATIVSSGNVLFFDYIPCSTCTTSLEPVTGTPFDSVVPFSETVTIPADSAAAALTIQVGVVDGAGQGGVIATITIPIGQAAGARALASYPIQVSSFAQNDGAAPVARDISARISPATTPSSAVSTAATTRLSVTVDATGLSPGIYSGTITINNTSIRVVVFIVGSQPELALTQTGLTFVAVAGGTGSVPQSFGVNAVGRQVISWTAQASTLSGGSWLSVSPLSGTSDPAAPAPLVEVDVNPAGLAAGAYYGLVTVSSPEAGNVPLFATVVLDVLAAGSTPAPVLQPTGLVFTAVAGGAAPDMQSVTVFDLTSGAPSITSTMAVLGDSQTNVSVVPGPPVQIQVRPNITVGCCSVLAAGVRQGSLFVLFSDNTIQTVNLVLVVAPGSGSAATSSKELANPWPVAEATTCTPTKQIPVFTELGTNSSGSNFNAPASWPAPIKVKVVDDCGNLMVSGSVVATFSDSDPPLQLTSLGDGNWDATWQPQSLESAVSVIVTANVPPSGTVEATGGVQANPGVLMLSGVVNAASFAPQAPLAPGGLVSLFGLGLGNQAFASALPLPTQLGNSLSEIRGEALPLLYSSTGQINAQIPFDVPIGEPFLILALNGSAVSTPVALTIAAAAPAVFSKDQSGTGQGVIVDVNNDLVQPGNPAKAGDIVVIYCTGLGAVNPPVAAGSAALASPLSKTMNPVTVTIGGNPASVQFAGLTPGYAGLYQVNAVVPVGVTPGDAVAVQLQVAGQLSPVVTMAVK